MKILLWVAAGVLATSVLTKVLTRLPKSAQAPNMPVPSGSMRVTPPTGYPLMTPPAAPPPQR